ncbi:hypothetical protein PACTADRAFT_49376 [Pachysolen tannophilus NRRL Y-2460]|uniref:Kinesin-like protein n=1 Tax=Pachysolen tannophilus NRRL Y-2460 TaxID=669874 RepID=A0A1E4TW00_PACTA|nr:hypothetical protein PACTADRAFT_49376 [Pachysolen tannophilus NRRL Y-2460]
MTSKESSITVAVRVRPFTQHEQNHLIEHVPDQVFLGDGALSAKPKHSQQMKFQPKGIRKILNIVDDRMLIFDPSETNPLNNIDTNSFNNGGNQRLSAGGSSGNSGSGSFIGKHSNRIREHRFVFDRLFDEGAQQEEVYNNTTKPLLDSILDGFNATVFAYGATGCGKTHTITGTPNSPGIIFLTMKELFEKIDAMSDTHTIELSLSYLEIYNETIKDLLNPSPAAGPKSLALREDENKRISVSNLSVYKPQSVDEVMELITIGNENRTISPTEANSTSSRSHAVLQINVDSKNRTANIDEDHAFATLSIIDLAGSERASATKNTGERLHEGANINKSLLALGNCINALCDPRRRNHVPYRDSKLTRLLKFSLGGNCKTVMIVCVSPSSLHYDETLNTLKYANRAKEIKTKVMRNQQNLTRHVGSYLKMITEQKQEIEELRTRESRVVEQNVMKQNLQREKCQKRALESLDELDKSIKRNQAQMNSKACILAKRKFLMIFKKHIDDFLLSFNELFGTNEDDFTEMDSILPGFSSILHISETLTTKLVVQIEELENLYLKENDLDLILNNSSKSILRKLSELDGWNSFDSINFESHISKLRDSVEKEVLYQSSILIDQSLNKLSSFRFLSYSLLKLLKLNINSENVNLVSLNEITRDIQSKLNDLLHDEMNLVVESSFVSKSIKTSPPTLSHKNSFSIMSMNKRANSPMHKSPTKISKPRSPLKTTKPIKKVRWSVPSPSNDSSIAGEEFENDYSAENTDTDVEMNDLTPLHEKLQKEMNISPAKEKYKENNGNNRLPALKGSRVKASLTSRKLIPPTLNNKENQVEATGNISFSNKNSGDLSPSKTNFTFTAPSQLVVNEKETTRLSETPHFSNLNNKHEDDKELGYIIDGSPTRQKKFSLGPPQRIFMPLKPSSSGSIQEVGDSSNMKLSDGIDENSMIVSNNDFIRNKNVERIDGASSADSDKNNENSESPMKSVFGNITSIF